MSATLKMIEKLNLVWAKRPYDEVIAKLCDETLVILAQIEKEFAEQQKLIEQGVKASGEAREAVQSFFAAVESQKGKDADGKDKTDTHTT